MQNTNLFSQILIPPNLDYQILEELELIEFQTEIKNSIHFCKIEFHPSLICFQLTIIKTLPQELKWISTLNQFQKQSSQWKKEIFLNCFEIKEAELEQIFKCASNWERLILRFNDIHCLKKLDFGRSNKCKTKFLSFRSCGNTNYKERKTDWITTPSCFKNIVEAISKSLLKNSLEEVDIEYNQTLKKEEVQAMFNELGMSHISVVEKVLLQWNNLDWVYWIQLAWLTCLRYLELY